MLTREVFADLNVGEQVVVTYDNEEARQRANWKKKAPRSFEGTVYEFRPYYLLTKHLRVIVRPRGYFLCRPGFEIGNPVTISKGWPNRSITGIGDRFFEWLEKRAKGAVV